MNTSLISGWNRTILLGFGALIGSNLYGALGAFGGVIVVAAVIHFIKTG